MKAESRRDLHAEITNQIVAAIEAGAGSFTMPWHRTRGSLMRPINVASGKAYQGINVLTLWVTGEARSYAAPLWGTYRQWQSKGAQVRKGEKSSLIVFYKEIAFERTNQDTGQTEDAQALFARASHVFNADQVDGYQLAAEPPAFQPTQFDAISSAESLLARSGARIEEGGDQAFYRPADDSIRLPDRGRFTGTDTITAQEAFYATALHELTHWTGAKHRLDRNFNERFKAEAYAFEELVAELGASYLCADLGVTTTLRPDHAAYIAHWLKVLRDDKKAIFTAASAAQRAATYLSTFTDLNLPTRPILVNNPAPDALLP